MGAPTVRCLQQAGHRVVVLSRGREAGQGAHGLRPGQPTAESVLCDRQDPDALRQVLHGPRSPRILVDFAAMRPEHLGPILEVHREGRLLHYVFVSTNMVYPGGPESMDVSALPQPIVESAVDLGAAEVVPEGYGGFKLRCEAVLRRAFLEEGLPVTVVRPPAVVGPGCDSRHERLQRLVLGLPPPPAGRRRGPAARRGPFRVVHSGDVGLLIAAAVGKRERTPGAVLGEAFNVASGEAPTALAEYVGAMAAAAGRAPPLLPDDTLLQSYERQGVLDVRKAERVLGFQPAPLSGWMRETVAWHAPLLTGASL